MAGQDYGKTEMEGKEKERQKQWYVNVWVGLQAMESKSGQVTGS